MRVRDIIFLVMCYLLLFQHILMQRFTILKYADEAIIILLALYFTGDCIRKRRIKRRPAIIIVCIIGMIVTGVIGGLQSRLQGDLKTVLVDIFYCFKVFIAFLGADKFAENCNKRKIIKYLAVPISFLMVVSACCAIINQFADIGMSSGISVQFSIKNYSFIFFSEQGNMPGIYSMYSYMYLIVLTIKAKYEYANRRLRRRNIFYLGCTLFGLMCTLQSRAIAFSLLYIALYYLIVVKSENRKQVIHKVTDYVKVRHIAALSFVCAVVGRYKFVYFFVNGIYTARYNFWKYGMQTMKQYFPIGSGFATFGTNQAFMNYSPLYRMYGMDRIFGLGEYDGSFASDTYWPAIIAQFGVIGTVLMIILLFNLFKYVMRRCGNNAVSILAGLMACIISLVSSIATASFFHFTTVGLYCVLVLNFDDEYNWCSNREEESGKNNSLYANL